MFTAKFHSLYLKEPEILERFGVGYFTSNSATLRLVATYKTLCFKSSQSVRINLLRHILNSNDFTTPFSFLLNSNLAWYRLGVEPAELSKIAENCEVLPFLFVLLTPRMSPEKKKRCENE